MSLTDELTKLEFRDGAAVIGVERCAVNEGRHGPAKSNDARPLPPSLFWHSSSGIALKMLVESRSTPVHLGAVAAESTK